MSEPYSEPVSQLLVLGDPAQKSDDVSAWLDYLSFGLTANDIPELVRMALDRDLRWCDNEESSEVWAPVHAWRALGQLRAESAVDPLLRLLNRTEGDDDWVYEDLPDVFAMIGPASVPELCSFLNNDENDDWARISVIKSLVKITEQFPDNRERAVAIISDQLRNFIEQERIINAYLVSALCDLKAVESAGVIEQAFAVDAVDQSVMGDWEEAQIRLGLLEERLTPEPDYFAKEYGWSFPTSRPPVKMPIVKIDTRQKKAKRKIAKNSRKRNRKR